jgi:type II secretory pathway pseudopilin PulG
MKKAQRQMLGFSLLESSAVVAAMGVLLAIGVVNTTTSTQGAKADAATSLVISQLRLAKSLAVADRRYVTVTFDTTFTGPENLQHLDFQVVPAGSEPIHPVQSVPIPSGAQFVLEPGVPDTPENFGNSSAVYFGDNSDGSTVMQFTPSGAFVDGNNNVLNGTVFLGVPGNAGTARAVTIMGGGGNVQRFYWNGSQWGR